MKYTILGPDDPALVVLKNQLQNHPEWNTELKIVPWAEYQPMMETSLNQEISTFQAVCVPGHIWLPGLVTNTKITPFEKLLPFIDQSLISTYNTDDIMPRVSDECKYQGNQYLLPLFTDGHLVFYRKDLINLNVDNNQVPVISPFDLMPILENVKCNSNQYPFVLKAHVSEILLDWLPYLWAAGGEIWDSENHLPLFNSPEATKSLEFYISLKQFCPENTHLCGNNEITDLLKTGQVALATSWGGQAAMILGEDNPNKEMFGVAVFEHSWNATWGISIPDNQNQETKTEILSVLMKAASVDQDRDVTKIAGSPVRKSSYSNKELEKYNWLHAQKRMLETCRTLPTDPEFNKYLGPLYSAIHQAFTGQLSAIDALNSTILL